MMKGRDILGSEDMVIVIGGMAKTGTTLPLTLLDGHSKLAVLPEELRFFHHGMHDCSPEEFAERVISDENIQKLGQRPVFYKEDDYMAHGGTGFGWRDYSQFDWARFKLLIRDHGSSCRNEEERFNLIMNSFKICSNQDDRRVVVCKAPHNEMYVVSWQKMLNGRCTFVVMVRNCKEHYASLKRVASMRGAEAQDVYSYACTVMKRRDLIRKNTGSSVIQIDYDELTRLGGEAGLREVLNRIALPGEPSLETPTKLGIAWMGNSSRGIVDAKIFENPHKADKSLTRLECAIIEQATAPMFTENGWSLECKPRLLTRFLISFRFWQAWWQKTLVTNARRMAKKVRYTLRR